MPIFKYKLKGSIHVLHLRMYLHKDCMNWNYYNYGFIVQNPSLATSLIIWIFLPFNSQDSICDSPYCLLYNSFDVSLENLKLNQPIIPLFIFFLYSHYLSAGYHTDGVGRNSVSVTGLKGLKCFFLLFKECEDHLWVPFKADDIRKCGMSYRTLYLYLHYTVSTVLQ